MVRAAPAEGHPAVQEGKPGPWQPWHASWASGQAEPSSLAAESPPEGLQGLPAGTGQLAISPAFCNSFKMRFSVSPKAGSLSGQSAAFVDGSGTLQL